MQTSVGESIGLQPVFIVGAPKSGTTFLCSLFDGHPNVVTLLETRAYRLKKGSVQKVCSEYQKYWMPIAEINPALTLKKLKLSLREVCKGQGRRVSAKAILTAMIGLANAADNSHTHFIEKTPSHYDCVDQILADFPNAKIIHVIRDPRDNYLSLKRRMDDPKFAHYQSASYHPITFIEGRLISGLQAAFKNQENYPAQYRFLYYEDLILEKEKTLHSILEWIDLPFHGSLWVPQRAGKAWGGNSSDAELRGAMQAFDPRSLSRWKMALSPQEVVICEWLIQTFDLTEKYSLSRSASRLKRFFYLALPFPDELRLELGSLRRLQAGRLRWLTRLPGVLGCYIRRRWAVANALNSAKPKKF